VHDAIVALVRHLESQQKSLGLLLGIREMFGLVTTIETLFLTGR
jgi:hypothetical protein